MLSLEGGFEELRDVRPIRSRRLASSVAIAVSCARSYSITFCRARIKALERVFLPSRSASEIPAGGVIISSCLLPRNKRESIRCQELNRAKVSWGPS